MTCQSSGRSPTIAIGLGPLVTPSRIRIPRPPQNRTTFTFVISYSDDFERGDGKDQPAAPRPDVVKLSGDFVFEVPGQNENIVGPGFGEALGRIDRDMGAREELPLLHRAPVNGVREKVRADTAVVEQRVALARGAVPGDGSAVARRGEQKRQQVALDPQYLVSEAFMAGHRVQPRGLLLAKHSLDPRGRLTGALLGAGVDAEGAAMRFELVDIDHPQAGSGQRM